MHLPADNFSYLLVYRPIGYTINTNTPIDMSCKDDSSHVDIQYYTTQYAIKYQYLESPTYRRPISLMFKEIPLLKTLQVMSPKQGMRK